MAVSELFPGFERSLIRVKESVEICVRTGGSGPALLMLHGHPQCHAMWHKVAPDLARHFTLVLADLRGYGDSSKPVGLPDHANYSRRAMAADMVEVMARLGHRRFAVLAHDRGARVAHRLALDHADRVTRMILLDIAPTLAMYRQTGEAFARAYWHWFFLIQPAPMPERLIEADPAAYVREKMDRRPAGLEIFDPRAMAEYIRCVSLPGAAHGICEDYRASAGIDLEHDEASLAAGERIRAPLLVLWGANGAIERCFKPLDCWAQVAADLQGESLPCGHYIAEEAPQPLLDKALPFLLAASPAHSSEKQQR